MPPPNFTVSHTTDRINNFKQIFANLQLNTIDPSDTKFVTLHIKSHECIAKKIVCHRIFLFNAIEKMQQLVDEKTNTIMIDTNHVDAFTSLIEFCYTGFVNIGANNVLELLELTNSFELTLLKNECLRILKDSSNNSLRLQLFFKIQRLGKNISYPKSYTPKLPDDVDNLLRYCVFLTKDEIELILSKHRSMFQMEEQVVWMICNWIQHDLPSRNYYIDKFFAMIDFAKLRSEFITFLTKYFTKIFTEYPTIAFKYLLFEEIRMQKSNQ